MRIVRARGLVDKALNQRSNVSKILVSDELYATLVRYELIRGGKYEGVEIYKQVQFKVDQVEVM